MIKIMTSGYYKKKFNGEIYPIDGEFLSLNINEIPDREIGNIIGRVDGVELVEGAAESKFTRYLIPISKLSSGCKTALVIAWMRATGKEGFVNISEAGSNALDVCLELLDDSGITGIISTNLSTSEDSKIRDILLNDHRVKFWTTVQVRVAEDDSGNISCASQKLAEDINSAWDSYIESLER